jgi:hypothetical protein
MTPDTPRIGAHRPRAWLDGKNCPAARSRHSGARPKSPGGDRARHAEAPVERSVNARALQPGAKLPAPEGRSPGVTAARLTADHPPITALLGRARRAISARAGADHACLLRTGPRSRWGVPSHQLEGLPDHGSWGVTVDAELLEVRHVTTCAAGALGAAGRYRPGVVAPTALARVTAPVGGPSRPGAIVRRTPGNVRPQRPASPLTKQGQTARSAACPVLDGAARRLRSPSPGCSSASPPPSSAGGPRAHPASPRRGSSPRRWSPASRRPG